MVIEALVLPALDLTHPSCGSSASLYEMHENNVASLSLGLGGKWDFDTVL